MPNSNEKVLNKVYCVIPVRNRLALTRRCIEQLDRQNYQELHMLVVDQACEDGTREFLDSWAREHTNLTVLKGDGSFWWTAAMQMGISRALRIAGDGDF